MVKWEGQLNAFYFINGTFKGFGAQRKLKQKLMIFVLFFEKIVIYWLAIRRFTKLNHTSIKLFIGVQLYRFSWPIS